MAEVKPGKYKHFKGKLYRVISSAKHSETLEDFIVYECLHKNELSKFWVRPKEMFLGKVEKDGKLIPRFEYIG